MPQRLSVFSSLTTIVVRHPVYFVVARICPKAIRKAPTLSVVLRPYALCYFLYLPPLFIPSPLSALVVLPSTPATRHIPTCRKDSTANIRPALLPHLRRSERPFSQRYPLQFCDLSVYTPAPRYFHWFISIKNNCNNKAHPVRPALRQTINTNRISNRSTDVPPPAPLSIPSGMVVKEDGTKWACQSCLKGHRVSGCTHTGK